jgi:hypothetical protein
LTCALNAGEWAASCFGGFTSGRTRRYGKKKESEKEADMDKKGNKFDEKREEKRNAEGTKSILRGQKGL